MQRFVEKERVSGIFFSATEVVWCRAVWRLVGRDAPFFFFFFFFAAVRAVRLSVDASFPPPRGRRRRGHDDVVEHFSSLVELLLTNLLLLLLLPRSFLRLLYTYSKRGFDDAEDEQHQHQQLERLPTNQTTTTTKATTTWVLGGDPLWKSCGGGVPLERAPSFCETNEFLSEKKKELCLGFRVSFNASLQFFLCGQAFVSSFVLSLFIYYKRLRRRRSDHLDFPNDEAIVLRARSRRALFFRARG